MTMLDRMRRHKSWLKWSLASWCWPSCCSTFPTSSRPRPPVRAPAPREVVAEVDGRTVTAGEFQQRYVAQMQAYRQQFGGSMNDQLLRQLGIDQQILPQMIDEQVGLIEAERHGITVSDDELAQQIFSIPALQENGRFIGEERYEQLLRSQSPPMTKAQFEDDPAPQHGDRQAARRADRLDGGVRRRVRARVPAAQREGEAAGGGAHRRRVPRAGVNVTDADVAAHFDAHKAEYRIGEQRKIKYLLLDRDQARAEDRRARRRHPAVLQRQHPAVPDAGTGRASHILLKTEGKDEAAVRKQAEDILAQVKAGADFAALAKKFSEDEGSKANGGDLDYFGRGRMVPEFENAAFAMQPGQISDLVKSQFGFHIIKVVDKRPASTRRSTRCARRSRSSSRCSSPISRSPIGAAACQPRSRTWPTWNRQRASCG